MFVKQISTDTVLEKLHDMYMEALPYPNKVREALDHIHSQVSHETYREIEDDLSILMDSFETRVFKLAFRVGFKTAIAFSQEELRD